MVNYLAVVLVAVVNMVLGFLWYGPLFGSQWMALTGVTEAQITEAKTKGGMGGKYALAFVGALLMGYVVARFAVGIGIAGAYAGVKLGAWAWLGLVVPVTLGKVLWDGKSWKLWFLENGYYVVTLVIMGAIIAAWR